ncbi:MAG: ABC transporter substrate-binding protein, partial [Planctomycetes bacterium]|nr:ABC transporter substrate-binding protein [Planctomycetota bacterium]
IAQLAATMVDRKVQRDAEQIVAKDPDLVIVSSAAKPEFVQQLGTLGIPLVQTEFDGDIKSIADIVRFMAYILGEVEQGERIVAEVQSRLAFVADTIGAVPEAERPGVLLMGHRVEASTYFDYHHSAADTLDKVDPIELSRSVAAMATYTYILADMPQRLGDAVE